MPVTTKATGSSAEKPKDDSAATQTDAKVEGGSSAPQATTSPATDADRPAAESYAAGANPTVDEGDKLAPLGTLSGNVLPPEGTGFHCGVCGQVVGREGQHYNEDGDQAEVPHANVIVVADNWPQLQVDQDQKALDDRQRRQAERGNRSDSEL